MIDPASGSLLGASDSRKDGLALGYWRKRGDWGERDPTEKRSNGD